MELESVEDHEEISAYAGQGRAAQRVANICAALLMPGLAVVPALLVRFGVLGSGVLLVNLISPILGLAAIYAANRAWHTELQNDGLLTARTFSGRRTIDLTRLKKVGRVQLMGGRGARDTDRLVLTDEHGVRLAVDKLWHGPAVDKEVAEAVGNSLGKVSVSRRAGARLFSVMSHLPHHRADAILPRSRSAKRHGHAGPSEGTALIVFLPLLMLPALVAVAFGLLAVSFFLSGADR